MPTSALTADSDKTVDISFTATDAAGNSKTVTSTASYLVDTTPPAGVSLTLDSVTADNTINIAESQQTTQTLTGLTTGGRTGDAVVLTLNGTAYNATIDAQGRFSVQVSTADLIADSDKTIDASFTATKAGGNSSTTSATKLYTVDTVAPVNPGVTVANVTTDNVINASESLTSDTVEKCLAFNRAIQHRVTHNNVLGSIATELVRCTHHNASTRQSLTDIVIRITNQIQSNAIGFVYVELMHHKDKKIIEVLNSNMGNSIDHYFGARLRERI